MQLYLHTGDDLMDKPVIDHGHEIASHVDKNVFRQTISRHIGAVLLNCWLIHIFDERLIVHSGIILKIKRRWRQSLMIRRCLAKVFHLLYGDRHDCF